MADQTDLTPIPLARRYLLEAFSPLAAELVPLRQTAGRVLAEAIFSKFDLPAFANSSMDGFAVRAADVQNAAPGQGVALKVVADIPAGLLPKVEIAPRQTARIMTGAALPAGADAVVPVERTDVGIHSAGISAPAQVSIFHAAQVGENVRPQGQDVQKGERVLVPNRRLRPQDVGVLAMIGAAEVRVFRRPRIGVMSPGDELLKPGVALEPGKIYESNSYMLQALISQLGAEVLDMGIVPDDLDSVRQKIEDAVDDGVDLLLSTGGVSVGAFDFVRAVLDQAGTLTLWRVNMRPGKPLAFGSYRGLPYFGLPGNPVSAYVGFQVFVRPALIKMMGLPDEPRITRQVTLLEALESDGRESYLRVVASQEDNRWVARLTGHQGSGNLRSLVHANALLIVPSGVKFLPEGATAEAWFFEGVK